MGRSRAAKKENGNGSGATLGFEATLWQAADKLRNNMDAAEYKHVVLGLIFLKYISDAFDDIVPMFVDEIGTDWENDAAGVKDICISERVFYVPPSARWKYLQGRAKLPSIS